jgi:alpha-L-arabinofuranosidase
VRRIHANLLAMALLVASAVQASDVVYRIRNESVHRIDSRLFGQFMERPSWGEIGPEGAIVPGTNRLQPEVQKLLRAMEIPVMRFPGGTDVDFMDWRDMVDNVPGRDKDRPVSIGHDGDKVTNHFGYDEFLSLSRQLESAPIIVVNFRDGLLGVKPLSEAALHAAGLVAYCNAGLGTELPKGTPDWPSIRALNGHPEPYGVKYWQIGNETWAFFKQLVEMHPQDAHKHYADCIVAFARAMLEVDPSIEFIVDGHGPTQKAAQIARKELGEKIRYTVFHIYKPWGINEVKRDGESIEIETLTDSEVWNAWVATPNINEEGLSVLRHPLLAEARRDGYKLAVTEWNWNGWWRVQPSPMSSSYAKGVGAAGFLHGLMRSADVIKIGCQSMLVGNSWGIHAIWADREGQKTPRYMPTGQVTMLYSQHHGSKLLKLETSGIPTYAQPFRMNGIEPSEKVAYLDALATAGENILFFHVINRHFDQSIEITVDLTDLGSFENKARHYMLEGRLNDSPAQGEPDQIAGINHTELVHDGKALKVLLPARTVSCIELYMKE